MPESPLPHAVISTGKATVPLAGGRSRRTANGVPILELRSQVADQVAAAVQTLLDPHAPTVYLTGQLVHMHTARARGLDVADVVTFHIGGSTLDEAAKECIAAFEDNFADGSPTWIASTSDDLAQVIADHYGCPVKSTDEELAP